jgi:flagellar protein FliS
MASNAMVGRYVRDAVETVSPERLVPMLYDTLVRDLSLAEQALAGGDLAAGNDRLVHAQEILFALRDGLDLSAWEAAASLHQLYVFLIGRLIEANVGKDPAGVAACRRLVEPLRDAWHEAAAQLATAAAGTPR